MNALPSGLLDLAVEQAHVLTRAQCLATGLSRNTLQTLVHQGRWIRFAPGVYVTVTGQLPDLSRVWAELLDAGEGAIASRETSLWLALPGLRPPMPMPVQLAIPLWRHLPARRGRCVHRLAGVDDYVGSPPRMPTERALLEAVHHADTPGRAINLVHATIGDRLTTPERILATLEGRPRQRHRALLLQVLGASVDGQRSELERADARNDAAHGLPAAQRQVALRSAQGLQLLDSRILIPETGAVLVSELDGRLGHEGMGRFRDMRRDNRVALTGATTLRFGWVDVTVEGCETAAVKTLVLKRLGWRGEPTPCGPGCRLSRAMASLGRTWAA